MVDESEDPTPCFPSSDAIATVRARSALNSRPTASRCIDRSRHSTLFDCGSTGKNRTDVRRPFTPPDAINEDDHYEGPEWSIVEDYALLLAITEELRMTYNLLTSKVGHTPNWDYVAGFVNRWSGHYRSPRQCSMRYQLAVLPREEGRLVAYDPVTKKARKVFLSQSEVIHMKRGRTTTMQQFEADGQKLLGGRTTQRCKAIRIAKLKRPLAYRRNTSHQVLMNSIGRMPALQGQKLLEFGIRYAMATSPMEQARHREEKLAERRKSQQETGRQKQLIEQQKLSEQANIDASRQHQQQQIQQRQLAIRPSSTIGMSTPKNESSGRSFPGQSSEIIADSQGVSSPLVPCGAPGTVYFQTGIQQTSYSRQSSIRSATNLTPYMVAIPQDSIPQATSSSFMQFNPSVLTRQSVDQFDKVGNTAYRQIAPQSSKSTRTSPANTMPVGYVHQQGFFSSRGVDDQLQLIRPILHSRLHDIRPKMGSQKMNRLILTTTTTTTTSKAQTDQQRAYLMHPSGPAGGSDLRTVHTRQAHYGVTKKSIQQPPIATVMVQGASRMQQHGTTGTSRTVLRQTAGTIPPIGMLIAGPTTLRVQQTTQHSRQNEEGGLPAISTSKQQQQQQQQQRDDQ